ncbi:MAG: hypothetical protein ACAH80_09590 [Alphaproteobacteria bacterium]
MNNGIDAGRRQKWRAEIDESKVDMGLIAPMGQLALDVSLYTAILDNDHQAIRAMGAAGANPNMWVEGKLGEPEGTLLHFAARHAQMKTVIALLQIGADPLIKDADGRIPRQVAAEMPTGNRLRSMLQLWEKKRYSPVPQHEENENREEVAQRA